MKSLTALALAAAVSVASPAAGMMHGMPREQPLLSLALHKEASHRMHDIEAAERELAGLVKQGPADFGEIEAKVRAVEKVRADLRLVRIRTIAEGRAALTPEQRAKLDQLAAGQGRPDGAK